MRSKKRNIIIILLLEILVAALIAGALLYTHNIKKERALVEKEEAVTEQAVETDDPLATLFFASDYQYESGWNDPKDTMNAVLDAAISDGNDISGVIMCGDYSNEYGLWDYQISPDEAVKTMRSVISEKCPNIPVENVLFIQGNHDAYTDSIADSGIHEYDDYLVYVVNTQDDFPWSQGKTSGSLDKVRQTSEKMKACFDELAAKGETRPIIIAAHVPLHYSARTSSRHSTGDNLYSSLLFGVINEAAEKLDIIYLFGHDHSKGWDCYLGGSSVFKSAGDTIIVPKFKENKVNTDEFTEETLNFTYMNAGYIGYYMNCGPEEVKKGTVSNYAAADDTLTGTVCVIKPDEIVLSRYSAEGIHPLSWTGEADPYKDYIDSGLIGSEYYSSLKNSPVHISRKNKIEAANYSVAERVGSSLNEGAALTKTLTDKAAWMAAADHVYSHRGSAGSYEHSIKAYDEAIAAGSHYIEQDLVISSDGVLFVSHDLNASGMTGVNAGYSSMKAEDIDKLRTKAGEKVLRLSEVFDRYGRSINYVIELKTSDTETVDAFEEIIEEYGYDDIVIVQSMEADVLKKIEENYPDMQKLFICKTQQSFDSSIRLPYVDIISVWIDKGLMTEGNCETAHEHAKVFSAWTLDSESSIRNAIDLGVDTYFTNNTALAIELEKNYGILEGARKEEPLKAAG